MKKWCLMMVVLFVACGLYVYSANADLPPQNEPMRCDHLPAGDFVTTPDDGYCRRDGTQMSRVDWYNPTTGEHMATQYTNCMNHQNMCGKEA